jgi:hypothetical protein
LKAGGRRAALLLAIGGYATLLAASAPAWPDDWDGVGFLESVRDFDLARFRPHPPGYPVYVALLRAAALVARDPMRACVLVAVASGGLAIAWAWDATRRLAGERAAWAVAVLIAVAPLAWRSCSGTGSEAPALACLSACAWGLVKDRERRGASVPLALGAGLGLGVRLSWAPIYLAMLALAPRGQRGRTWGLAAAAILAWGVPFAALVGPSRLVALYAAHASGHAARWGGTIATEPGGARIAWLARDLFVDGLGVGADVVGLAVGALALAAAALGAAEWRAVGWRGRGTALLVAGPYLAWIALGQNLRDQPRHALPLVAMFAGALGLAAGRSRGVRGVAAALAVAIATRTGLDAYARRTVPPSGVQLVALARAQPAPDRLSVFGVASVRFFETTELADRAFTAGSVGDAQLRLTRLDALPSRVWVTSELEGIAASPWPMTRLATLCRPARLDRRLPCLDVYDWRIPFLLDR